MKCEPLRITGVLILLQIPVFPIRRSTNFPVMPRYHQPFLPSFALVVTVKAGQIFFPSAAFQLFRRPQCFLKTCTMPSHSIGSHFNPPANPFTPAPNIPVQSYSPPRLAEVCLSVFLQFNSPLVRRILILHWSKPIELVFSLTFSAWMSLRFLHSTSLLVQNIPILHWEYPF